MVSVAVISHDKLFTENTQSPTTNMCKVRITGGELNMTSNKKFPLDMNPHVHRRSL